MTGSETEVTPKRRDRKLGDEWSDWDADAASREPDIDETRSTFFILSALVVLIFVALMPLAWYLIKPRIEQISTYLAVIVQWAVIGLAAVFSVLAVVEGVFVMKFGKSLFPYKVMEKFLLTILPKAVWLGSKFGISRDRVGNSFIKVHNFVTKSYAKRLHADRLLVLLPRCLRKEARNIINEKIQGNGTKILTVAGGEEAREAIMQYRPSFILAIACERDLMSGIKDVAEKVPVLAIANKRPEGPCKNTDFSVSDLEEALRFIAERRNRNVN